MRNPTPGEYDRIQSVIDGVDAIAVEMENKWGRGRLRLLVDTDLRIRFDEQRKLLNEAIWDVNCGAVDREAAAMIRGWKVLDQAAADAGASPLAPVVWETQKSDGTVIALVRTNAEASAVVAEGRYVEVWTIDEVARLSEATEIVAEVKKVFPGSKIVAAGRVDVPLNDLNDPLWI